MRRVLLTCAVLAIGVEGALAQASVEGRVELPKSRSATVVTNRYEIVTKGGILSPSPPLAVVYLEGSFQKAGSLPTKQIVQKDLMFMPALLPVRVGTKVEFPNLEEDIYHNIFSYSPAKRFDLGRYRPDEKPIPSEAFDVPAPPSESHLRRAFHAALLANPSARRGSRANENPSNCVRDPSLLNARY